MARTLAEFGHSYAWLFSGMKTGYSGQYSFLAWGERQRLEGDTPDIVQEIENDPILYVLPHWYGVIGYEAAHPFIGGLPPTLPCSLELPDMRFCRYACVLRYDHAARKILYEGDEALPVPSDETAASSAPPVAALHDTLPYDPYCDKVRSALSDIRAGSFYQVNLTRKYQGSFARPLTSADAFALFMRLCAASPAPYSALFDFGGEALISSSPELFISADGSGRISTRPIKGTAIPGTTGAALRGSMKDRAENLMIVDLMRNDLSRCCVPGSVSVPALYEVDAFSTLSHLSSTVQGRLRGSATLPEILRAVFPPGSMTGAPKRAAMQWIAAQEGMRRGWYSGAAGWIQGRRFELSVVIRSLIVQRGRFEFQVGGGIVADSDPHQEYWETLVKAAGISAALGLTLS